MFAKSTSTILLAILVAILALCIPADAGAAPRPEQSLAPKVCRTTIIYMSKVMTDPFTKNRSISADLVQRDCSRVPGTLYNQGGKFPPNRSSYTWASPVMLQIKSGGRFYIFTPLI